MVSMRRLLAAGAALVALVVGTGVGAAQASDPRADLQARVARAIAGSTARQVGVAVAVDGMGPAVDIGGNAPMPPASTQKLYTAAAAFASLGPEYKLHTEVRAFGELLPDGTLIGDLVLRGGGDVTLTGGDLQQLANDTAAHGVHHVTGSLYGDDTRYDRGHSGRGWKPDYTPKEAAPLSAIVVDRNEWRRDAAFVKDPVLPNVGRFRAALQQAGVAIDGPDQLGSSSNPGYSVVATHDSPPLWQIIRPMMKDSDNFVAEQLLKETGTTIGVGNTDGGIEVAWRMADAFGIGRGQTTDGSGLSGFDRETPWHEVGWLLRMAMGPRFVFEHFLTSLAVGCGDGTLKTRFCGTPGAARVFAKTGTLDGIVTLAGYTSTAQGHRVYFSIEMSGVTSPSQARAAIDRAVNELAAFPG